MGWRPLVERLVLIWNNGGGGETPRKNVRQIKKKPDPHHRIAAKTTRGNRQ